MDLSVPRRLPGRRCRGGRPAESCISREGDRSATVVEALRTLDSELGELPVVMSSYNDPASTIAEAIAAVVDDAGRRGVRHVVWLSLRTGGDVDDTDPQEQSDVNSCREYNERLVAAAASSDGFLQVADWATHSAGAGRWFEADGVHLTADGHRRERAGADRRARPPGCRTGDAAPGLGDHEREAPASGR